jgi:hypothetical protein
MADPQQPAMRFVTVDATSDEQAFKDEVDEYAAFLETRLARYRHDTQGTLTLKDLRDKVIPRQDLWDDMFHLVYAAARVRRLEAWGHVATATSFGVNLLAQALGDLCLVAEQWLRIGWPDGMFFELAVRYLNATRGGSSGQRTMEAVSKGYKAPGGWGTTVGALLDRRYSAGTRTLDAMESDLGIAYIVRNTAFHSLKADPLLASRFADIEASIFSAIFAVVERLPTPATTSGNP